MTRRRALALWTAYVLVVLTAATAFRWWGSWPGLAVVLLTVVVGMSLESAMEVGHFGPRAVAKRTVLVLVLCTVTSAVALAWYLLVGRVLDEHASPWLHLSASIGGVIVLAVPFARCAHWMGLMPLQRRP